MEISALQKARYEYAPKLPGMLRNGIADICVKEGEATQSVADQDKIKALFPNTYGEKEITFEKGQNTSAPKKQRYLRSLRRTEGYQQGERTVRFQGRPQRTDQR